MTRFDEVARLRELDAGATCAPWRLLGSIDFQIVSDNPEFYINFEDSDRVDPKLITDLRNVAPWLLEAAACFQPGDAERIARIVRDDLLEGCCGQCDADVAMMHRLQKAAAIMEGLE